MSEARRLADAVLDQWREESNGNVQDFIVTLASMLPTRRPYPLLLADSLDPARAEARLVEQARSVIYERLLDLYIANASSEAGARIVLEHQVSKRSAGGRIRAEQRRAEQAQKDLVVQRTLAGLRESFVSRPIPHKLIAQRSGLSLTFVQKAIPRLRKARAI